MPKLIFTTRPRLASMLSEAGCSIQIAKNPYDENRPSWQFLADCKAMKVVCTFYKDIGTPLPISFRRAIETLNNEATSDTEAEVSIAEGNQK